MVRKNICCTVVGLALAASLAITRCNVSIKVSDKELPTAEGAWLLRRIPALWRYICFLLQYYLVLVTKYRKPVICRGLAKELERYLVQYFKDRDLEIQSMECMPDHVHILFDAKPNMNLVEFVNALKSASSRRVRKLFAKELDRYYWKPYFWSLGYFIGSVSNRTTKTVKNYIKNQKDNN